FINSTSSTDIYSLSLHDALPISSSLFRMPSLVSPPLRLPHTDANPSAQLRPVKRSPNSCLPRALPKRCGISTSGASHRIRQVDQDRKSTRLNSSHDQISYAVFCL